MRESIGTIRFNRPARMNAVNTRLTAEFLDALLAFDNDDGVRVLIVTGVEGAFCAGLDIGEAIARLEEHRPIPSCAGPNGPVAAERPVDPLYNKADEEARDRGDKRAGNRHGLQHSPGMRHKDRVRQGAHGGALHACRPDAGIRVELQPSPGSSAWARPVSWSLRGTSSTREECLAIGLVNRVVPAAELETFTL